jgi:GT2 family glycosyltransferase
MNARAAKIFRHPLWTAGTLLRGIAAAPALAVVKRAASHLFRRTFSLRLSAPARRWSESADESAAIRWIGPVNLRHRTLEALLCLPSAGVEYRAKVPAGARFVCACGLSPEVWQEVPPPVEFTIALHAPAAGDWRREVTVSIDPGSQWTDRRWHLVSVPLPHVDGPAIAVNVTLSTRVPAQTGRENAWALFGDPRFEWRRTTAEVRRSVSTFAGRIRTDGLRTSIELLRVAGITGGNAEAYLQWVLNNTRSKEDLALFAGQVAALPYQPLISVLTPVHNTDPRWLRACIDSVRRQAYPNWELCICDDASSAHETVKLLREYESDQRIRIRYSPKNGGISAASNTALELARGDFVALLDHDDELAPDALAEVVKHVNEHPDADVIYSDEDKLDTIGARCDPYFKPDWSPEHFLSTMYTCHLMVVRRQLLEKVGGFRTGYEGAQDYDLLLRLIDQGTDARVHHIPRVLYHWRKSPQSTASAAQAKPWALDAGRRALEEYVRRNGIDGDVLPGNAQGLYRIRRRIRGNPLVSIVIPTSGRVRNVAGEQVDLLANAISSVVQKTAYPHYEFVIVADEDELPATTRQALENTRHQVLRFQRTGRFNFSAKVNAGAAASSGEHLLFFNDDLEATSPEWLSAMVEYSQEPAIGAVGAKLVYPDGRLQHIGMVLGVAGVAAHAFHQHPGVSPGYAGSAILVRNYSAVTAACLMTRRTVYDEAGRFDEHFPVDFNDVDYCLKLRRAGYRVVFTPWAQLCHHESASFGVRRQDLSALAEMRRRWAHIIDHDPYYNPNLTHDFPDFRIDT